MKLRKTCGSLVLIPIAMACLADAVIGADFIPIAAYRAANDSPFPRFGIDGMLIIEDFEDGELNTRGVKSVGSSASFVREGFGIASEQQGGETGRALESRHLSCATSFPKQCPATVELQFNSDAFGILPTYAGFVWTDAVREFASDVHPWARVTVTDAVGNVESQLFNELPLRETFSDPHADDTFISYVNQNGISKLTITVMSNGGNGGHLAIDHLQYGVASLAGDVDLDGDVDFADFTSFAQNFGRAEASWRQGDFDFDGQAAFPDFLQLSGNFGKSLALPARAGVLPVPEPSAALGASWIGLALASLRLRSRRPS